MSSMNWSTSELAQALSPGFKEVVRYADASIQSVVTDSRLVKTGDLFVCLKGERFDAHDFAQQVMEQGAIGLVVDHALNLNIPQWVVTDTRLALGQLAKAWRAKFAIPFLGVVGSNGKTTSKEMLASICKVRWGRDHVLVTEGNLNNDIGVPQTLLRLRSHHLAAVIEMGMNHPSEIAYLAQLVHPHVAMLTNAQREHQEFMKDVRAVAEENGSVFEFLQPGGVAVFPANTEFDALWVQQAGAAKCVRFGDKGDVSVRAVSSSQGKAGLDLELKALGGQRGVFEAKFLGSHNHSNAAGAASAALSAGCTFAQTLEGLHQFAPVKGRMNPVLRTSNLLLIDDSYNANPDSVNAASKVLATLPGQTILVLGDMGEVGDKSDEFHAEVGAVAAKLGVSQLLAMGVATRHSVNAFGAGAIHQQDIEELIKNVIEQLKKGRSSVLVKGSRFMKMERVVQAVLQWAESTKGTEHAS
ncbi:MAG: UDP-N-acetylmuramoyl-tripeptide--D-alanyl-D-alanine ligase [Limnobacter sp.]|nr:UDP-N-acetylmuramoyl-tripeptide--D-alanyl-D-alanine ligase [Limnobacter sp.]